MLLSVVVRREQVIEWWPDVNRLINEWWRDVNRLTSWTISFVVAGSSSVLALLLRSVVGETWPLFSHLLSRCCG